jgi:anaerobic selenocysteine-containing dehydrogenase
VFIYNTNPAQTLPNSNFVRRGLARDDVFVVLHDTHWTETAKYSDIILPATSYLEKRDIVLSYSHRFVRVSDKAIQPIGESKNEVWVMRAIARELGIDGWVMEDPWRALENALKDSFENCSFQDLLNGKTCILKIRDREIYHTPTGKIELYSTYAERNGYSPLPLQRKVESENFILITSSLPQYTHTQFQDVYGEIPKIVFINPSDARKLDIADGDLVRIYNNRGDIILKASISGRISNGVLWAPKVCNDIYNRPINILTLDTPQEIGMGSSFNSTRVKIEKYTNI